MGPQDVCGWALINMRHRKGRRSWGGQGGVRLGPAADEHYAVQTSFMSH